MVTSETRRSLQRTTRNQGNKAQGQKGQIGTPERRAPQQAHQSQGRDGGMGGGRAWESKRFFDGGGLKKQGFLLENLPWRLSGPAALFFFLGGGFGVCNQVCNELREVCNPSVINYGKSVTRSVMRCFIGLQIPTLIFKN